MKVRRLTPGEQEVAVEVFGDRLNLSKLLIVEAAPTGGWAISLFGLLIFPREVADFSAEPIGLQAWFIHELAHAWQFRNRPIWTVKSWLGVVLSGGYRTRDAYSYNLPFNWRRLNLEQQAKVVEHRFLLSVGQISDDMPPGARLEAYDDQIKSRR